MPLLRLQTSAAVPKVLRDELLYKLSETVARVLSKPETFMMVIVDDNKLMVMGGVADPAAFLEVRAVGQILPAQAKALSSALSELVGEQLKIVPSRIYLNFQDFDGSMWGYNGSTFG